MHCFPVWLISLSIIPSRSIHVVACGRNLFFFMTGWYSIPQPLYPFICWWAFRLLPVTVNNAAMNIGAQVSAQISIFIFFGYMPRRGIAESCESSILVFWGISILFSTVVAQIYVTTISIQGFPFLHILINICYVCSFWW